MRLAWILGVAAALAAAPLAFAHVPPAPSAACGDGTDGAGDALPHDFVVAGSVTATTGLTGQVGVGVAVAIDGAFPPCATADFCVSTGELLRYDVDGENPTPHEDPHGEDVVVYCASLPPQAQTLQVPQGDGEPEFGVGGAFLSEAHHDLLADGYEVDAIGPEGPFVLATDVDGDGDVEAGDGDCVEPHATTAGNLTAPEFTTACAPGAGGGWWLFAACGATAFPDAAATTDDGPARGLGDADADGVPDLAEDGDSDGVPDGAEDDDADGLPDALDGGWDPEVSPGDPDPSAGCLLAGHVA